MADKRMFHRTIVLSDDFMDLSAEARCLYFTLGMLADDDGMVNAPKGAMRRCGTLPIHLQELIDNKFIISFDSGIVCIKHWCLNNTQRKDRKKETPYTEELRMLEVDEQGIYSLRQPSVNQMSTKCQPSDNQVTTKCPPRIEENRIEENRIDNICQQVVDIFHELCPSYPKIRALTDKRKKHINARLHKYSLEEIKQVFKLAEESDFLSGRSGNWKASFDWIIDENHMIKILEGNYKNQKGKRADIQERDYDNLERMLLQNGKSL